MSSNAIASMGTKLYRYGSSAWAAIAEITGIEGPSKTRETIEVTTLDSVSGYREFIAGLRDGGTINISMNFWRTTFDTISDDFESDTVQNYAIVINDADRTTIEFEGLVIENPISVPVGDKISADVVIKVTGAPVISDGSSGAFGAPPS